MLNLHVEEKYKTLAMCSQLRIKTVKFESSVLKTSISSEFSEYSQPVAL